jgi:hypothetical protein
MLRIDEIYQNTFWPWFKKNLPGHRVLFCDPFGRSDPDSIINYGWDDVPEHNYTFFFDQEPIHLNIHMATFEQASEINWDLSHKNSLKWLDENGGGIIPLYRVNKKLAPAQTHIIGHLVTSERDSDSVDFICNKYHWKSHYYFFHGWAALDWYRGYDKTFLIKPIKERNPTRTFIAPNRIIAGERKHRLEMLYHIFKQGMTDNHISCPAVCPVENISIVDAAASLLDVYPDIQDVFRAQQLPIMFKGETDHPMHSCWLSLFDECADSLLYLVTETVATGRRHHLTEKTFKPIALGMPFVLVATQGSLEYLRSYGFKTFGHIWDETYDTICDPTERFRAIGTLLKTLHNLQPQERLVLYNEAKETIQHNWNHFYGGGFESVLWTELNTMLKDIDAESSL